MTRISAWLTFVMLAAACGGSPANPSGLASGYANPTPVPSPAPTPPAPPTTPPPIVLTGRVIATNGGRTLDEIGVAFAGQSVMTDITGAFRMEWPGGTTPPPGIVTLTGRQIVPRSLRLSVASSRDVSLDAIFTLEDFDLNYYRQLVRNGLESPGQLRAVRRWTRAPMIYLKTVDEAGQPIDAATLNDVAEALGNDTGAFTGERFGIAGIQRGNGTQEGVSGWITVKFPNPSSGDNLCGRAQVAVDGGWIELNYLNPYCTCRTSRVGSATVRHEMGHALGFFHTDGGGGDLMFNTLRTCEGAPSKRERLHAAIAYSRPNGNIDPDTDGDATTLRPAPIIVLP